MTRPSSLPGRGPSVCRSHRGRRPEKTGSRAKGGGVKTQCRSVKPAFHGVSLGSTFTTRGWLRSGRGGQTVKRKPVVKKKLAGKAPVDPAALVVPEARSLSERGLQLASSQRRVRRAHSEQNDHGRCSLGVIRPQERRWMNT